MQNKEEELLRTAYYHWRKSDFHSIELLPASGSHRKYYRILSDFEPCLCVYNEDEAENRAYLEFSKQFLKLDLPVPHILQMDSNKKIYFVEDLGNTTLFSFLQENRKNGKISSQTEAYYFKAVEELLKFQLVAGRDFDYSSAYPRKAFDAQSMQWDLSSFKYYFLKLGNIPFNEQELENDFQTLIRFLEQAPSDFFLYRDFQARNIMIHNDRLFFIDFQGGRKGALAYDLASLLYDGKANL
ncbi:MAG: phosphotransferase, partial [Bacteroidales bacterium]